MVRQFVKYDIHAEFHDLNETDEAGSQKQTHIATDISWNVHIMFSFHSKLIISNIQQQKNSNNLDSRVSNVL